VVFWFFPVKYGAGFAIISIVTIRKGIRKTPGNSILIWRNLVLRNTQLIKITLLLILPLLLIGCSGGIPGLQPTPTNTATPTATPTPTETPTPTATPLPPVGVLLVPEGADHALAEQMQSFLSPKISQQGMRFQVRPSLSMDDFERDDFQWIIAIPPFDGLDTLAAAQSQARFLAVGFDDLEPSVNLTVIAQPDDWYLQQAFIAGYMSMVITPDWRGGMIRVNTPEGELAGQSFKVGALCLCSSPSTPDQDLFCRPDYAPVYQYPIIAFGEPDIAEDEWPGLGRYMLGQYVETIFISPEVQSDQLLRYLAQEDAHIIGSAPPPNDIQSQWVASLEFDLFQTFQEFWSEFETGTDGLIITVPLTITHVNPELLSPGRQQFVEMMLENVIAGYVDYGLDSSVNNP